MKILLLFPAKISNKESKIGPSDFMIFKNNEIARSLKDLGQNIEGVFGYKNHKRKMNGFSKTIYFKIRRPELFFSFLYHFYLFNYIIISKPDVVFFNFHSAHLIPFSWLLRKITKNQLFILDIRSIPVDLKKNVKSKIEVIRFNLAIKIADKLCDGITCITPMLGDNIRNKVKNLKFSMGYFETGVNFSIFNPKKATSYRKKFEIENRFIILYHGVLSPNRGLQNVILAVNSLKEKIPNILFMIVGAGEGENELKNIVRQLNLEKQVDFLGTVPLEEIPNYIKTANLGIIPLPKIDWWNVSSPIKLKEYLAMALPVIATDIPAHRSVIEKTGGAILIKDNLPETIDRAINDFYKKRKIEYPLKKRADLFDYISYHSQAKEIINFLNNVSYN